MDLNRNANVSLGGMTAGQGVTGPRVQTSALGGREPDGEFLSHSDAHILMAADQVAQVRRSVSLFLL